MRRRQVVIVAPVEEQILTQVLYIARDSVNNAIAWEVRVRGALERLGDVATDAVDEYASERLGFPVRKFVFEGTYLIHYRVKEDEAVVKIVNFRHGARLPRRGEP